MTPVWQLRADSVDYTIDAPPAALLVTAQGRDALSGTGPCDVRTLSATGASMYVHHYDNAFARPLFSTSEAQVVFVRSAGRRELRIHTAHGFRALKLGRGGDVTSWAYSSDHARFLLLQEQGQRRRLTWMRFDPSGSVKTVATAFTRNEYVSLSPDGRTAILGGFRPKLVGTGGSHPRLLPINFVSEARWCGGRILLMRGSSSPSGVETLLMLIDRRGRVRRRCTLTGDLVHTDDRLRYAASTDRDTATAHLVSLRDGRVATLNGVDDVYPVSPESLFVVTQDGKIDRRSNPLGR
jgi:hypothetical protein